MKTGMAGVHKPVMRKDEWLTPPKILRDLGPFDLDPCAPCEGKRPWGMAEKHYCVHQNGIKMVWFGLVWCNPPYGKEAAKWLEKMSLHNNGIALIFARTETDMFFKFVWEKASGVLFIRKRLYFHHVSGERADNNSGAPSCLVSYGNQALDRLCKSQISGKLIKLKETL